MLNWIEDYEALIWIASAVSVVTFVATLIAMPVLIVRLPADYFIRRPVRDWVTRRPALHLLLVVAKNVLGAVLLVAGVAMLVLPGQGLLTILVGVMLLDFPGKRRFERWLICRRPMHRTADWMRARRGRPPLDLPGSESDHG